jgi:adenylylsulfate kinase-like enzyme
MTDSSNLSTGHVKFLGRSQHEKQLGQRAGVFWLYGLSGSGKSTLAAALEKALHAEGRATAILDGDLLRTAAWDFPMTTAGKICAGRRRWPVSLCKAASL